MIGSWSKWPDREMTQMDLIVFTGRGGKMRKRSSYLPEYNLKTDRELAQMARSGIGNC
jgi:hypothetical protein